MNTESAECPPPVVHVLLGFPFVGDDAVGVHVDEELKWGLLQVKDLLTMLIVLPDSEMAVPLHVSLAGLQFFSHQFQQGTFSGTIRSDQGYSGIQIHTEVQVVVQVVLCSCFT